MTSGSRRPRSRSTCSCLAVAPAIWVRAATSRAAASSRAAGRVVIARMGEPPSAAAGARHLDTPIFPFWEDARAPGRSAEDAPAGQQVPVDGLLDGVADLVGQVEQGHRVH